MIFSLLKSDCHNLRTATETRHVLYLQLPQNHNSVISVDHQAMQLQVAAVKNGLEDEQQM